MHNINNGQLASAGQLTSLFMKGYHSKYNTLTGKSAFVPTRTVGIDGL